MEGGARKTQAWMFGSPAQAAETRSPEQQVSPAAGGNNVYFATGSAEIPPDGRDMIRAFADASKQGTGRIEVSGYADAPGPADHNERLSQRRAEAVVAELAAQGVPRKLISVDWHGAVPTAGGGPDPKNRRISIAMTSG